jgi:predicted dehydrogenase
MTSTPLKAFIERPAGYLGEKVDADTGWVFPTPNETYVHGHDAMMADVVGAFRAGREPRETFRDGYVVNAILGAAYRSMESGHWEAVRTDAALLEPTGTPGAAASAGPATRAG